MKRSLMVSISLVVLAGVAGAAMDDVIIWNGIRTVAQIEDTLQNGYSDTTGMRLWWDFSNPGNLGYDATGNGHNGNVHGNAVSLATDTPSVSFAAGGLAASGFTSNASMIVGNPQLTSPAYYRDRTYEMWIRNPLLAPGHKAVFFSITSTEMGGWDDDVKRMWVNEDGSLTMADRGYFSPQFQVFTSDPLAWVENAWYQITVIYDYKASDRHDIRVYRGQQGDSQVELIFDYESSSFGNPHWLAVGGHPQGYYWQNVGSPGFLGEDTYIPEPATMALLALGGLWGLRRRA